MAFDATDHAAEVAGTAAMIAAVIPWSVSVSSSGFSDSVALRFVFGSLELAFGARSADVERTALSVTEIGSVYTGDLARVATLWLVAAALLAVALVLGIALLAVGDVVAGPFDPVRIVGALCLCTALALSGATWLLFQHAPRTPIPLGVVACYFFGAALLTIDRSHVSRTATETSG